MGNLIEIGKIVNTHGIRGEVKVAPWCDDPFMFVELSYFYADGKRYEINRTRVHKNSVIIELAGISHIDDANAMRNKIVTIERDVLGELDDGVYYIQDLLGLTVFDENGEELGVIDDVIKTGSNDVYVLKRSKALAAKEMANEVENTRGKATVERDKPLLVPALKDVILDVDIEGRRMVVRLPEGLLEL